MKAQGFSELAALAEFQRLVLIMLGGCHSSSGYVMLVRVPVGTSTDVLPSSIHRLKRKKKRLMVFSGLPFIKIFVYNGEEHTTGK